MTYSKGWRQLSDIPVRCPVCEDRRTDPAAIAVHNLKASQDGCRTYPRGTYVPR